MSSQSQPLQPVVAFVALADLTAVQIAREVGMHPTTVRNMLRGKWKPNDRLVDWCVRRFALPAQVLFREPTQPKQEAP